MELLYEYLALFVFGLIATALFSPGTVRLFHRAPSLIEKEELTEEEVNKQVARGRSGAYVLLAIVPIASRMTPEANWLILPFAAPVLWYATYRFLRKFDPVKSDTADPSAG
jgi:hypothetical protein